MFNEGTRELMAGLPDLHDLDPARVRRLLTTAYLDVVATRDFDVEAMSVQASELRHLATALELHAVLAPELPRPTVMACAFVAAEALEVLRELDDQRGLPEFGFAGLTEDGFLAAEAGALYVVSGYDANAAVASRAVAVDAEAGLLAPAIDYAAFRIRQFLSFREVRTEAPPDAPDGLRTRTRVQWGAWLELGRLLEEQVRWLRIEEPEAEPTARELAALAERLIPHTESPLGQPADYSAQSHLADLFGRASAEATRRALRSVSAAEDAEIWHRYVRRRTRDRPLIWPPAQTYASAALPGPVAHAVVSVPTGAGKSAVAEMAIAQALERGWVLYLAPTNALVAQIMRDLSRLFADDDRVTVRAFVGGSEYTDLAGEAVEAVGDGQVLVMTPEKCSLALRQDPEAFERLALLVFDECHLLGDKGSRGVISELVVSEALHRSESLRVLMLSAMLANAGELARWLGAATEQEVVTIEDPWRPTRTVRALLGVDPERTNPEFQTAVEELARRPNRRNWGFDGAVNLLASLQGAWSGADPEDYSLVKTGLTVELNARKDGDDATVDRTGYLNPAAGRLTHRLASSGERVLTFLPANKHHSFSVARDMEPLQPRPRRNARLGVLEALLVLADDELGVETPLREMLERGVGVHTSAMLITEQRASEIAFLDGQARALFATGTLAQGLNLPATSVVIGGTRVGHDPTLSAEEARERERAQLLNAVGRAGRAYVSERSLAVVIPNRWIGLPDNQTPARAKSRAPFLGYEDASTVVESQVERLIGRDFDEPRAVEALSAEEQTAFSFLALGQDEINEATVRHSFGGYRAGIGDAEAERIASGLRQAGESFVRSAGVPDWVGEAAHAAGLPLPTMFALHDEVGRALGDGQPVDLPTCRSLLVAAIGSFSLDLTRMAMSAEVFSGTLMEPLFEADRGRARREARTALDEFLKAWMEGGTYTELAALSLGAEARDNPGRGSGNPLPKVIGLVDHGIRFGLSGLAGGLAALAAVGERHEDDVWALREDAKLQLDAFPLAVRLGCDDLASTAWCRWGFRNRRVARVLARAFPPPDEVTSERLGAWIRNRRMNLDPDQLPQELGEDRDLVRAAVIARRVL